MHIITVKSVSFVFDETYFPLKPKGYIFNSAREARSLSEPQNGSDLSIFHSRLNVLCLTNNEKVVHLKEKNNNRYSAFSIFVEYLFPLLHRLLLFSDYFLYLFIKHCLDRCSLGPSSII